MSSIKQFADLCEDRMEYLRGTIAIKATSYVNTDNASDKREAKQAMIEFKAWEEAYGHFKTAFNVNE